MNVRDSPIVTRRHLLIAGLATALGMGRWRKAHSAASQPTTPVNFAIPSGACDCHVHVFGDPRRFPLWSGRTYTPETAPVQELSALHRALHIERTVIVTPLIYGTDNSCTVDALRYLGARARAVALIDEHTTGTELDELHRAGVRGLSEPVRMRP